MVVLLAGFAGIVFYLTTQVMQADKMFLTPHHRIFANVTDNAVNENQLVTGCEINGAASCYPIQIIAYHHKVYDTVGGTPVLITYCSVCRTGRVYSPIIDGKFQDFRLVGMDHFNAMLEDAETKSWWRQENGEAVAGMQKGKFLTELPSQQMTLKAWINRFPQTRIMQPDPDFKKEYASLEGFDYGTINGSLEGTSHNSWEPKSWVIGINIATKSRAYDWMQLKQELLLNDTLNEVPLLLVIEEDLMTFHVWSRIVNENTLNFVKSDSGNVFYDSNTNSTWNYKGECVAGPLSGSKLSILPAYQEFWHSWQQFHPNTSRFSSN